MQRVDASAGVDEAGVALHRDEDGRTTLVLPAGLTSQLGSDLLPQLAAHFTKVEGAWGGLVVGQGGTTQSLVPMPDGRQAFVRIRVDVRDNRGSQAAENWLEGFKAP